MFNSIESAPIPTPKRKKASAWAEIFQYREVLERLVTQQIILRYRRTFMGYLWTLINPLLMMSVMALVFSTLFKSDLKTFALFLFTGMIPWNFFSASVTQAGSTFVQNEGLIKKIYLPKSLFPLSLVLALLIDSFLSFLALFIIILALGGWAGWPILFIPLAYLLLFVFTMGIALVISVATVFFRDLQHVIAIAMQGLFFLTPVFYRPESIESKFSWVIRCNPVVPFIEIFRAPLYNGKLPELETLVAALVYASISFMIGFAVFRRFEQRLVFRL